MNQPMPPDELVFRAHVASARFLAGEARGRWRLVSIVWPFAFLLVAAKDGRDFPMRFQCDNYPNMPPNGTFWDIEHNLRLPPDRWPKGGGRVAASLKPSWKDGMALYLPCDRMSIEGHDNWRTEHPSKIWNPQRGIVQYLEIVHDILQSRDYVSA